MNGWNWINKWHWLGNVLVSGVWLRYQRGLCFIVGKLQSFKVRTQRVEIYILPASASLEDEGRSWEFSICSLGNCAIDLSIPFGESQVIRLHLAFYFPTRSPLAWFSTKHKTGHFWSKAPPLKYDHALAPPTNATTNPKYVQCLRILPYCGLRSPTWQHPAIR